MNTNQLSTEPSPYLRQHQDNPIHWQVWGEGAFAQAACERKPVFLSVGYSTCHWCHVMAHESFEDQEVADQLNANFVCIKVDREERPDVDQIYMSALQNLSGGGGWPMSLWLTSDGKPFFAGTYFPKYRFLQLLRRIQEIWSQEPDKLLADAERLMATLQRTADQEPRDSDEAEMEEFLKAYTTKFQYHFDEANGGFGGAPKFPQTMNLMVMMRQDRATGLNQAEVMVTTTLSKMLRGGIYDHLRGGFHRYSVDERWLVPHFEKMLYDQALLVATLVEAHQLYGEAELARAARETCDYVLREMTSPGGGFYSAQDADSLNPSTGHMEEGYFCTFDYAELRQHLSAEELTELERVYGVTPAGNFEGRNILNLQEGFDGTAKSAPIFAKLEELRASRPVPHLDDKVIAAWNGWMIWALVKAGQALAEPRYLQAASKALLFIQQNLVNGEGQLHRFWREAPSKARAVGEDYAALILACVEMYQVDFNPRWAEWALSLQATLDRDFWDHDEGNYFSSDGRDPLLPIRLRDDYDGVSPCSNSMAVLNLSRFYLLTGDVKYHHQARRIAQSLFAKLERYPSGLPFLALALDFALAESKVVVLSDDQSAWPKELRQSLAVRFEPHVLWAMAETVWPVTQGKADARAPKVYTCLAERCLAPAKSRAEAEAQIRELR